MKLTEIVKSDAIVPDLEATERDDVLAVLIDRLGRSS